MNRPITIVGPGRLGRSAAHILTERGIPFVLVKRGQTIPPSKVTWLTVPDREIKTVSDMVPTGGIVLHASGAKDTEPLSKHTESGSLHPLMTFPGPEFGLPDVDSTPAAVAGTEKAVAAAKALAHNLGFTPFVVSGDRALYHASAVIAGNFASVLLCEAARVLQSAGVAHDEAGSLLLPLAIASLRSAAEHGPKAVTGPIARGDEGVIRAHTEALNNMDPELVDVYTALTEATRRLQR